ncbi:hypothetical protein ACFV2N_32050 [Streptomyces sp. NPDC059680]|uniref:hypothetical protein n=1 Tax=Streptomyces sp. NPDC059680 TaxID=3346904 RepID=UPI0036787702
MLAGLLRRWQNALDASGRVPASWDQARKQDPDHDVLSRAGFEPAGLHEFSVEHHWTIRELAGYIRSTSFLPPPVLAEHAAEFDAGLTAELGSHAADGHVTETVAYAYRLAHKPALAQPPLRAAHEAGVPTAPTVGRPRNVGPLTRSADETTPLRWCVSRAHVVTWLHDRARDPPPR